MRWACRWFWLAVLGSWGCGSTDHNGGKPDFFTAPTATGGAFAGGNAGGGGELACGAPARAAPPQVAADVSFRYSWSECGRIAPSRRPAQALYGADGSLLVLTPGGIVEGYTADAVSSSKLFTPPPPLTDAAVAPGMSLSADGRSLVLFSTVLEATDGQAIGATSTLREVTHIDTAGSDCDDTLRLSPDGKLAASLNQHAACVWQVDSGQLLTTVPGGGQNTSPGVLGWGNGPAPLLIFGNGVLSRYDLNGTLASSSNLLHLGAPLPPGADAAFSVDGETLLVVFAATDQNSGNLLAFDAGSGAELWRQHDPSTFAQLAVSSDGYALVSGGQIYDISDGAVVGKDADGLSYGRPTLGLQGKTKLALGEQVAAWDLTQPKLLRLYGSHTQRIAALDITPDGRYLASHGDWAVVWELKPDFSQSIPLFNGAAPDDSWDVAIAPDGGSMLVSGDNIGYFRRDGSVVPGEVPPPNPTCLSADWAFSPDGCWLAGTHYSDSVGVRDARDFSMVTSLATTNCGGGVAFSPDGSRLLTADLELFDTRTWELQWGQPIKIPPAERFNTRGAVDLSPRGDEFVLTGCAAPFESDGCSAARYDFATGQLLNRLPTLSGNRTRYSPEGHWLAAGNKLLHVPSGVTHEFSAMATSALFTPEGDIISGESDGSLVRYCRNAP
jgi:WD40 repeat protein